MRILEGERISKTGMLLLGCTAFILDSTKQKVLLVRRIDNGRWVLPGGHWEPGESVAETCEREVWEETGLKVLVRHLIGVYSNPNRLFEYPDGQFHNVALNFAAEVVDGTLKLSEETTGCDYFSRAEIQAIDLMEHHYERIEDGFNFDTTTFIR